MFHSPLQLIAKLSSGQTVAEAAAAAAAQQPAVASLAPRTFQNSHVALLQHFLWGCGGAPLSPAAPTSSGETVDDVAFKRIPDSGDRVCVCVCRGGGGGGGGGFREDEI